MEVAGNEKTCSLVIILNDRSFRRSVRIEKEVKRIFNGTMEFKNQRIPDSKNLLARRSWQLRENWSSKRIKHLWKLSADFKNFTIEIYRYRCKLKLKDVKFLRKIFNDRVGMRLSVERLRSTFECGERKTRFKFLNFCNYFVIIYFKLLWFEILER